MKSSLLFFFEALLIAAIFFLHRGIAAAQESTPPEVQNLTGRLEAGAAHVYLVRDLKQGDILTVYMKTTSGNLDPAVGIIDSSTDLIAMRAQYQAEIDQLVAQSKNVVEGLNEIRDRTFLAWDDDGGEGYAAALNYIVPASGDFRLIASGSLSAFGRPTAGDYDLLVGINAPDVLGGHTQPTGEPFVVFESQAFGESSAVEEMLGSVDSEGSVATFRLADIKAGDTLFMYVEPTSGSLIPAVLLRDFGGKPVEAANLDGAHPQATLQFVFPEGAVGYTVNIQGATGTDGRSTTGDFRALVGLNAPDVLTGQATATDRPVIKAPIEVQLGINIDRISEVDSQGEDFTVLGSIRMDWTDPALAFSPDSCNCDVKVYTEKEFDRFLADANSQWPDFSIFNQQGNRWIQNRAAVIWPDGRARYSEQFTTTFQADFDFRNFPFDVQTFPIFVDMIFPDDIYTLTNLPGYSVINPEHGEDEFIIGDFTATTSTVTGIGAARPVSRITFSFDAPRHLNYYFLQVFLPILLIILISWFTFFLRDFSRRIEAAAANILLFIAFSFSLADNYPRLGYITFLDAVMAVTFAVNTLVLLYNVYLKRLENEGGLERIERIDRFFDWAYPLLYVALMGVVVFIFFRGS